MPNRVFQATLGLPPRSEQEMETIEFRLLLGFSLAAIAFGFVLNTPAELWAGTLAILSSPSVLLTDYMAVGGAGATFVNAGLMMLIYVLYVRWHHDHFTGPLVAALFTVFGFSFFGKNLLNSVPITFGVFLWARMQRKPSSDFLVPGLLGTALAPSVSYLMFGQGLPLWASLPIAYLAGMLIGLLIPPMAATFVNFHRGTSLYNVGFTAGMVGMAVLSIINIVGRPVPSTSLIYEGDTIRIIIFMYLICAAMLALGLYYNRWSLAGMSRFFAQSGRLPSDFFKSEGVGRTFINMGLMGLICSTAVLLTYGRFSGSVLGAIFTVIGFSAFGKHVRNAVPIMAGVFLSAAAMGYPLGARVVLVSAFFGSSLAPMAGVFGPVYGVVAGFLHMALVANVAILHGGLNLYNNGFSAGLVAIILFPIFTTIYRMRGKPLPELDL